VLNSLYVQVLRSPILAALLHGTPAAGVSQTVGPGTRKGITGHLQLQRVPPIFGWVAIRKFHRGSRLDMAVGDMWPRVAVL